MLLHRPHPHEWQLPFFPELIYVFRIISGKNKYLMESHQTRKHIWSFAFCHNENRII